MKTVDARGLSCPQPVLLTKKAVASGETEIEVLVDNVVPKENVTRFATSAGYAVSVTEDGSEFKLLLKK